ncbi:MAG: transcriptional repressor LexA [Magnetococcales bacterium]|nr:transcriptional repressor LexA [Magnetococcales bacterium]
MFKVSITFFCEKKVERKNSNRTGRIPATGLSSTLEKSLAVISNFIANEGVAPSVQELAEILGISGASAHEQIRSLEKKGYIKRTKGRSRSITILKAPHKVSALISIPVIGKVAAGVPILAVENIIGEISVPASDARGICFALLVEGESMVDAGINDGDYIVVRQQPIAENGDIVVAFLEDEATVKRLYISEDRVELRAANINYKPIVVAPDDHLRIVGKVMAVSSNCSST